jgi:hypothetical protein
MVEYFTINFYQATPIQNRRNFNFPFFDQTIRFLHFNILQKPRGNIKLKRETLNLKKPKMRIL